MAQYHLSGHPIISRTRGQKVIRSAAYAAGERLRDDRYGEVHDFTRRRSILYVAMVPPENGPDWARDREKFWNAVEKKEKRKDSQLAIPYDIALPHELSLEQNIALIREYAKAEFADLGLVADVAIHEPDRRKDERNVHAHILIPTRRIDGDGFGPKPSSAKSRKEWEKDREENIVRLRKSWAEHANRHLAAAGFDVRIDHRSLEEQGIDREPTRHRGVASDHMEQRGIATDRGEDYREIQAENEKRERKKRDREMEKRRRQDYPDAPEGMPMPDDQSPQDKAAAEAGRKEQERQDQARRAQEVQDEHARLEEVKKRDELGKAHRDRIEALAQAFDQRQAQLNTPQQDREHINAFWVEQNLDSHRARMEFENLQRSEQVRSLGGPVKDAGTRYTEALAQNYDQANPWPSLAKTALQEYAMFKRDQESLEKQIQEATDPTLRKGLILRQAIEGYEYLATTGERIAKMSEIVSGRLVNGRLVSEESTRMRGLIHHTENGYLARAKALRNELRVLQKQPTISMPGPSPTRERRPRERQSGKYAKMVEEINDPEAARKRKEQEELDRQRGIGRGKDERER